MVNASFVRDGRIYLMGFALRFKFSALLGMAFIVVNASAFAADLLPPAAVIDEADEGSDSGWYLRGDIGAIDRPVVHRNRDLGFNSVAPLIRSRFDGNIALGGGAGYRFSPWFRADVTIDRRFDAAFKGTRFAFGSGYAEDRADFESTTLLINGYVDLPFFSGITPYVGAGLGVSRNRLDGGERWLYGASGQVTDVSALASQAHTDLAWALMTGVAIDITGNLTFDLGYRYSQIGDARARIDGASSLKASDVAAHEFRIGARYRFD